jgi:hypothetical protein
LLGQGFGEAKRAAAEGVEAIKAEAGLYAFALGKTLPTLVAGKTLH